MGRLRPPLSAQSKLGIRGRNPLILKDYHFPHTKELGEWWVQTCRQLQPIDAEQTGRWKAPFGFMVHLNFLFLENAFGILYSQSLTQPVLFQSILGSDCSKRSLVSLCLQGNGENGGKCGILPWGKGKLENEEGSRAWAAAKLFKTIFSTGLIILPHGIETPLPYKVCVPFLRGTAY